MGASAAPRVGSDRWKYLDHPGPIPFAHRGGALDCPENTMKAFENAVRLGYRYVETDVHVTSDGVVVAFHDDVLDRVTDRTGAIAALPWAEVSQARVGGIDEGVPKLDDLLAAWPDLRVNIDAKADGSVEPLVKVIERTATHDRVCLGAFSDRRIAHIRRLTGGRVCTSMGPGEIARLWAWGYHLPLGRFDAACAQVPVYKGRVRVTDPRFVRTAHRRGLAVHVWTVDDRAEMERLLDMGVDGIMSDSTTVLKDVMVRRGLWV